MARKITLAIFSILFSALFLVPTSDILATSTGTFSSSSFSSYSLHADGTSTRITGEFKPNTSSSHNDYPYVYSDTFVGTNTLNVLCFYFNNLDTTNTSVAYNLSFGVGSSGDYPLSLGSNFDHNIVYNDDVNSVNETVGEVSYTFTTHNVSGVLSNSSNRVCFQGAWLYGSNSVWELTQATLTTYPLTNSTVGALNDVNQSIKDQQQIEDDRYNDAQNEANSNSSNSSTSSDDSQSKVDNDSKNLFEVLTSFVSSITSASPSSCSITGDFGFFNVGSIDVCSGASRIQPITTVVGTIMLIGLIVPAVVTLLHRFIDLYNEVTN